MSPNMRVFSFFKLIYTYNKKNHSKRKERVYMFARIKKNIHNIRIKTKEKRYKIRYPMERKVHSKQKENLLFQLHEQMKKAYETSCYGWVKKTTEKKEFREEVVLFSYHYGKKIPCTLLSNPKKTTLLQKGEELYILPSYSLLNRIGMYALLEKKIKSDDGLKRIEGDKKEKVVILSFEEEHVYPYIVYNEERDTIFRVKEEEISFTSMYFHI